MIDRALIEVSFTVISIVAILVGAARWLLSVYYDQQRKLSALEQSRTDAALYSLDATIDAHGKTIQSHKDIMNGLDRDLKYVVKHLDEIKIELKEYSSNTDKYIANIDKRMSVLEALSENLKVLRTPKR